MFRRVTLVASLSNVFDTAQRSKLLSAFMAARAVTPNAKTLALELQDSRATFKKTTHNLAAALLWEVRPRAVRFKDPIRPSQSLVNAFEKYHVNAWNVADPRDRYVDGLNGRQGRTVAVLEVSRNAPEVSEAGARLAMEGLRPVMIYDGSWGKDVRGA